MPSPPDMLERVFNARVGEVLPESTPLETAERLTARLSHPVLLKREDLTSVFSFKLRGAYNRVVALADVDRARGAITASAGNRESSARHIPVVSEVSQTLHAATNPSVP